MIHITGTIKSRFQLFRKKIDSKATLDTFLEKEEMYHQLTDITPLMNHSKFFLDNSGTNDSPNIIPASLILNQIKANPELFQLMNGLFRPNIDDYFMKIAFNARARSNCMKRAVGSVIVKNNRVLSVGTNGTPSGVTNCYEGGCVRCNENWGQGQRLDKCFCLHAEESAVLEVGAKILGGATLYSTLFPCLWCAKMIIQCKITRVVYVEEYSSEESQTILKNSNITLKKL